MNEQYVCKCAGSTCNGTLEDQPCPYVKPHGPADCGAHCSHDECIPECTPAITLDEKYQQAFRDAQKGPTQPPPGWTPPCPACQGEMVSCDDWLVTRNKCSKCGWSMSYRDWMLAKKTETYCPLCRRIAKRLEEVFAQSERTGGNPILTCAENFCLKSHPSKDPLRFYCTKDYPHEGQHACCDGDQHEQIVWDDVPVEPIP